MHANTIALILAISASAFGYSNNCEGSSNSPDINDCYAALDNIDVGANYEDQAEFSTGSCYLVYATNGSGPQPVSGQTVHDIASNILAQCGHHKGSFGTGKCDACHVTVNYRSPKKFRA
ncbi:hypothetical protein AAFC00_006019 [Neodothiora populina]|uniref:Uncharacterized protein n=1 Tax=Neodothiora populina TaxID=2781224 RepID=A0ABR3P726_9PEZI